jgi:hypothetical protein
MLLFVIYTMFDYKELLFLDQIKLFYKGQYF